MTDRLLLRAPRAGDASAVNAAICESIADLRVTMPWAQTEPTFEESEAKCRLLQARFLLREDLTFFFFERGADGGEGGFVGGTGLHRVDWAVRRFAVGYWCRVRQQRRGFATEAARAIIRLAFETLRARRVEIRMDNRNERSRRVAERLGFDFEALRLHDDLTPQGDPSDMRVYARIARAG